MILFLLSGTGILVTPSAIEEAIENYIRSRTPDGVEFITEYRNYPKNISVSNPDYAIKLTNEQINSVKGNITLPIEIFCKDKLEKKIFASLKVRTFEEVFIVEKMIQRHQSVGVYDCKIKKIETTSLSGSVVKSSTGLGNKRAKRILAPGTILTGDMLEEIPMVDINDRLVLKLKTKSATISTEVFAKEAGQLNDVITVENTLNRRKLKAKVVSKQIVEMILE